MPSIDELLRETSNSLRAGNLDRALTLTDRILALDPENQEASELSSFLARGRAASATLRPFGQQMKVTFLYSELRQPDRELTGQDLIRQKSLWSAYYDAASQVVERYDGEIVSYRGARGGGLLIAFGYPRSHEDDARRAVHAALGIRAAVERLRSQDEAESMEPPRIGIHSALATPDPRHTADLFTLHISTVERIQQEAGPGTVVVSGDTARLVAGYFETRSLGQVELRSLPDPMDLVEVVRASDVDDRLDAASMLTPLVGRVTSQNLLLGVWNEVSSGRHGSSVLITGEAGIGKSRLAQLVRDRAAFDGHAALRAHCSPYYTLSGFHAITRMLESRLDLDESATTEERFELLTTEFGDAGDETIALLAPLLDIPAAADDGAVRFELPEYDRDLLAQKTVEAVVAWWGRSAATTPCVVLIEDLQWADRSTLRVVEHVVSRQPIPGLLLVVTARPDLVDKSWLGQAVNVASGSDDDDVDVFTYGFPEGAGPDSTPIEAPDSSQLVDQAIALRVHRLSPADIEAMIDAMPGGRGLSQSRRERIAELSDGVPLFIEELVRSGSDLPEEVEELLQAKVRSAGGDLQNLQIASVIGSRRVRIPLLVDVIEAMLKEEGQSVSGVRDRLIESLDRLVDQRILERHRGEGEDRYRFTHALIRDAAYETMATQERTRIHGHVAEQLAADESGANPATVALHYENAGRGFDALSWYGKAAQEAFDAGAAREAIEAAERALRLVEGWPESSDKSLTQMQLLMLRGGSYQVMEGYGSAGAYADFSRAQLLSDSLRERYESAGLVMALNAYRSIRGERDEAGQLVSRLEALLESTRASSLEQAARFEADVDFNRGLHEFFQGNWTKARDAWERSLYGPNGFENRDERIWEGQTPPSDPHTGALAQLIPVYWVQGEMSKAESAYAEALRLTDSLDFPHGPFMRAYTHTYMGWTYQLAHHSERALGEFGRALVLGAQHGFAMWEGFGGFGALVSQLHLEFDDEGLAKLDEAMGKAMEQQTWAFGGYYGGQRAWFEHVRGNSEAALGMFDAALGVAADKREQHSDAHVRCMKARVLFALDRDDEAVDELKTAYDQAREQEAHAFALEAATAIAEAAQDDRGSPDFRSLLETAALAIRDRRADFYPGLAVATEALA